jgi:hypothetical protein
MNDFDLNYLKERISWLRRKEPTFPKEGELNFKDICYKSADELEVIVKEYESEKAAKATVKIKEIVDKIFELYGEEGDNMIVTSMVYVPDRTTFTVDEYLERIYFDGFAHKYNPFYYPVSRGWKHSHYKMTKEELEAWRATYGVKFDKLYELSEELNTLLYSIGIDDAESHWVDNNDALNEYWYGVVGITKDYKVVSFVIRDDGMLCDERSMESTHNSILKQL